MEKFTYTEEIVMNDLPRVLETVCAHPDCRARPQHGLACPRHKSWLAEEIGEANAGVPMTDISAEE